MKKIIDRDFIEKRVRQELTRESDNCCDDADENAEYQPNDGTITGSKGNNTSYGTTRILTDREAERFEKAIMNGVIEGLSIDELAKRCCYSLSTFKRRFSEQYSLPPHKWMLQCRLNLACEILKSTDEPISSVATICGFINNSHFIATFRRHYRTTPRQYRQNTKRD